MKGPQLRSQLAVVAGLFLLYAGGVGTAFVVQNAAHGRLEAQFHKSLEVLTTLPHLRDQLRRVDQTTDQYLATGQRSWLDRRNDALDEVNNVERHLGQFLTETADRALLDAMDKNLTTYLAEANQWVSRRRSGRWNAGDAAHAARLGRELAAAAEPLSALGASNTAQLRARREELEHTSQRTMTVILFSGAAAALFVALFLFKYMTSPVSALREHARKWALGKAWNFSVPGAGPEVSDLADTMREMAERLNVQFAREAELGKLKGSLVSMASHEFNNALGVLVGMTNLLKVNEPSTPQGHRAEHYEIIEMNLRALALAVSNLLDLGRLEDGRFAVRTRRADLRRIVDDAAKALKPLYVRKNIRMEIESPDNIPPAEADPEALVLVTTNLLGNAVKYTPDGGQVTVKLSIEPDQRLRIAIQDTGIGIAPEERQRILTGHRTEAGRKVAKGFGVGLTIVKRVLDAHHSTLQIDSAPVKGSVFSFVLPRWVSETADSALIG